MFYYIYYCVSRCVCNVCVCIHSSSEAQSNRGHTSNTFFSSTFFFVVVLAASHSSLFGFVIAIFYEGLIFYIIMTINVALCVVNRPNMPVQRLYSWHRGWRHSYYAQQPTAPPPPHSIRAEHILKSSVAQTYSLGRRFDVFIRNYDGWW